MKHLPILVIVLAVLGHTFPIAQAQEATNVLVLEEITVTAQRREESLQDVPLSISAFSSDIIERSVIETAADYLLVTPNVGFSEDGEGGSRSINVSIRGVSNITLDGIATASSIGYYVDELSVGGVAQGTINPHLQDMQRLEVLRGPQGTFFGRNAIGGAINIATKKPDETLYLEGSASVGNYGGLGLEAIVNIPFSDKFMARVVVAREESDTPVKNVNPLGNDPFYEYETGRVSFRMLPSDAVVLDLSITHSVEDEGGDIAIPSGVTDLDTIDTFEFTSGFDEGGGFYPSNDRLINRDTIERNDKEFTIVNGRITVDLNTMQFKSITGFIDSSFDRESDLDGIAQTFGPLPLRRVNDYEAESFSQEFRLQSMANESIDWTLGIYYAEDKYDRTNQIQRMPDDAPSGTAVGFINSNIRSFNYDSFAAYVDVTWHRSEKLDLTLGGRYSQDEVFASEIDLNRGPMPVKDSVDSTDFSPRMVVQYFPREGLNIYGSISKGYKAGGTDVTGGSRTTGAPFKSEDLLSYELGFKSRFAGGRVSLSGAYFSLQWDDFQVQTNRLEDPNDIGSAISTTQNADEASATGFELELLALGTQDLTLGLSLGYTDAEFDKYPDAVLKGNTNSLPNVIDVSGQPLPRTPEWSYSASADWQFNLPDSWKGFVRTDWTFVGKQYSDIEAIGSLVGQTVNGDPFELPQFPYEIDSYSVVNLSIGVSNDNFRILAFGKNLLDEQYYTGTADNFGAAGIRLRPHQLTYGIKFTYMTN